MKSFAHFLLIIILAFLAGLVMPWWSVAVVAFLVSLLLGLSPGKAFFSGFAAIFVLWLALAFYIDVRNDHILANRMSQLFFGFKNPILIGVVSAVIGGITAGMASLSASYLRAKKAV
jgi:hypothetical protein